MLDRRVEGGRLHRRGDVGLPLGGRGLDQRGEALRARLTHVGVTRRGHQGGEAPDPLRPVDRHLLDDHAAERHAEEVHPLEAEVVAQPPGVVGHVADPVRHVDVLALEQGHHGGREVDVDGRSWWRGRRRGCRTGSRRSPRSTRSSQKSVWIQIIWAPRPITSNSGGSSGSPKVSYSSSMPLAGARMGGMFTVARRPVKQATRAGRRSDGRYRAPVDGPEPESTDPHGPGRARRSVDRRDDLDRARAPGPTAPPGRLAAPSARAGWRHPSPYDVLAFPNRWPPLPEGRAEIVLYTSDHDASFADLSPAAGPSGGRPVGRALGRPGRRPGRWPTCWSSRTGAPRWAPPSPTPTGRSTRSTSVPPARRGRAATATAAALGLGAGAPGDRLVATAPGGWRAWVPAAAVWPYELVLAPEASRARPAVARRRGARRAGSPAGRRRRAPRPALRRPDAVHAVVPPAALRRRRVADGPPPRPRHPAEPGPGRRPLRGGGASSAAGCGSTRSSRPTRPERLRRA